MDQVKQLLIATVISTTLLTLFLTVVGLFSPREWEVHARTLTALSEAEVRARLVDPARWEAIRGVPTKWAVDGDGVAAAWRTVELELTPSDGGVAMVQRVGPSAVEGQFTVADTGEQREVRLVLRGEVDDSPLSRLVLRLDRHRFQDRAQVELDGLLSEEAGDPEGSPAR